jgi:hypothetical protein
MPPVALGLTMRLVDGFAAALDVTAEAGMSAKTMRKAIFSGQRMNQDIGPYSQRLKTSQIRVVTRM